MRLPDSTRYFLRHPHRTKRLLIQARMHRVTRRQQFFPAPNIRMALDARLADNLPPPDDFQHIIVCCRRLVLAVGLKHRKDNTPLLLLQVGNPDVT